MDAAAAREGFERAGEWLDTHGVSGRGVAWGAAIFVATLVGSAAAAAAVVARLPADHFVAPRAKWSPLGGGPAAAIRTVAKNAIGLVLFVGGVLMSLPGVPGQGLLTAFVGLLLLDLPGKRRVEARLARSPRVLGTLNGVRARLGKPPFEAPGSADR